MTKIPNIARINMITDKLLNDDEIYSITEVIKSISAALPQHYNLTLIIRERSRFERYGLRKPASDNYLLFPYLSFGFAKGLIMTYQGRDEVAIAYERLKQSPPTQPNDHIVWNSKYVGHTSTFADDTDDLLVKAVARCILSFYYTCHSHQHFLSNVTRTYVQRFYRQTTERTIAMVLREIEQRFEVYAAFAVHTSRDPNVQSTVDDSHIYEILHGSKLFRDDLAKAVAKKGEYIGQTETQIWNYSIHTIVHEFFDHARRRERLDIDRTEQTGLTPEAARRGVLIIASNRGRLNTDALTIGPKLVESYLASRFFLDRENVWFELQRQIEEVEQELAVTPVARHDQLKYLAKHVVGKLLQNVIDHTLAEGAAVRIVNPFESTLVLFDWRCSKGIPVPEPAPTISLKHGGHSTSARAFHSKSDIEDLEQEHGAESPDEPDASRGVVFSIPMFAGTVCIGTFDCYSRRERAFEGDRQFLRFAAREAGALLHRLDLANDAAWLTRLSFLHAARHKLEQFQRVLESKNKDMHSALGTILHQYKSLAPPLTKGSSATLRSIFLERFAEARICVGSECFLSAIDDEEKLSERARGLIVTVLDTLIVNAKEHLGEDGISPSHFSFNLEHTTNGKQRKHASIRYLAPHSRVSGDRLVRICRSPIPDDRTDSYHFGLFLLAAQIRMVGGAVFVSEATDRLGNYPLALTFSIPLV